jgi:hypothetical protein
MQHVYVQHRQAALAARYGVLYSIRNEKYSCIQPQHSTAQHSTCDILPPTV